MWREKDAGARILPDPDRVAVGLAPREILDEQRIPSGWGGSNHEVHVRSERAVRNVPRVCDPSLSHEIDFPQARYRNEIKAEREGCAGTHFRLVPNIRDGKISGP